jgi:hypothetical protein
MGSFVQLSGRSAHLDNVKALLMFAVIWYHSLLVWYSKELPVGVSGLESLFLLAIMPGFAMVSGFLASPHLTRKRQDTLVTTFFVFVIFQLINWLMDIMNKFLVELIRHNQSVVAHSNTSLVEYPVPLFFPTVMDKIPDTPGGLPVTWFLLCLLFWRALTPLLDRLKQPIITSLVIGMLSLTVDLGFGSQNIVSFLPYYVVGYIMNHREHGTKWWDWLVRRKSKALSCGLFCFAFAFILPSALFPVWWKSTVGFVVGHAYGCLYGLVAPTAPLCTSAVSFGTRAVFYVLSFPAIFSIVRFVPSQKLRLCTKAGVNSVSIYLWHPVFLFNIGTIIVMGKLLNALTATKAPPYNGTPAFLAISGMALFFFCVLSANFWRVCCGLCLSPPVVKCLFVPPGDSRRSSESWKKDTVRFSPDALERPGGYTVLNDADDDELRKVQR